MNGIDCAKALALGSDITASARIILQEVMKNDVDGVIQLLNNWFATLKNIMYLTGCNKVKKLSSLGLKRKEELV